MRRGKITWLLITAATVLPVPSLAEENYWQQYVHYKMNLKLDTEKHVLTGDETILYKNNSPDTLRAIYLFLYPNAYKDNNSVRIREYHRYYHGGNIKPEDAGYIDITSFKISMNDKQEETSFRVDDTILRADLPEPLLPGAKMTIELSFYEKMRKKRGRAGYRGKQYEFAQWYPKVCVYDQEGWHPYPFHYLGEFYGEFGTFDVTMTVPYKYIVVATGVVTAGDPGWKEVTVDTSLGDKEWNEKYKEMKKAIKEKAKEVKMRTVSFHADKVHDFAWLASADFLYEHGEYDGIPIHVLYRAVNKKTWSKVVVERARRALEWLSTKFGRYPYPQLSITNFIRGGGMEYPMLVMNGSASEGLILHEVGHIYFYGILANNEQKEAWLDEGFTTFQTSWYMENHYGPLGYDKEKRLKSAPWFVKKCKKCYPLQSSRESNENHILHYLTSGFNEPISRYAYKFREPMSYGLNAYSKGSAFYRLLRYVVGDETWERICHAYFDEWKFKHVNEARFKEVCERISGMDLDWLFNEWLHDTVLIDYALGKVKKESLADGSYKTTVEVIRKERGIMPVEVLVETETGEKVIKRWDGKGKKGTVEFVTKAKAKRVVVDPNNQILDKNLLNNGPIKFEVYPDCPTIDYHPRDAYLLQWRPSMWYNGLDGLKLGLLMKGNYMGRYHNLQLGMWYGPMSKKVDFSVHYFNPVETLGGRTWAFLGFQKMEGRSIGDVGLSFTFSKYLSIPPFHYLRLGFNYSELRDSNYAFYCYKVRDIQEWEKGIVNKVYFAYHVNPRGTNWFSDFRLRLQSSQDFLGSDFNFNKVSGEAIFRTRPASIDLKLRWFAGSTVKGGRPPLQELFWASGANPKAKFGKFWLRSKGAFPREINYHLGGDGNLRGYYSHFIYGKQIIAFNFEWKTEMGLPLISELAKSLKISSVLVGFFDTGKVWDEIGGKKYGWSLSDAGVGIRFNKKLFGRNHTLRVDFPIWLSKPLAGNEELKFRWVMSFSEAF